MAKQTALKPVTVKYDLFDLPTSQHKAGLAGLVLQIRHMEGKTPKPKAIPKIVELTRTSATIEFTADSVQCLFDEVYAATREPGPPVEKPFKNSRTKKVVPWHSRAEMEVKDKDGTVKLDRQGNPKKVQGYVYLSTVPMMGVLEQHLQDKPLWMKLHREMMWSIPFDNEQTRIPYELRAGTIRRREEYTDGEGKKKTRIIKDDTGKPIPVPLGEECWESLAEAERTHWQHVTEQPNGLTIGAQDQNAEALPFLGLAHQNVLLHFWPLATPVYSPAALKIEREGGKITAKSEFVGYVLAIPEVTDLKDFVAQYPRMLTRLHKERRGYRPAEAVIDLPAEGALSFLEHLARVSGEVVEGKELSSSLGSVEFIQLHKPKGSHSIKTLSAGRVSPRPGLLQAYLDIVGRVGEKPPFSNPLFRRGLLLALLNDQPWYRPFGKLFAERDVSFFVPTDAPPKLLWFWADARKKFQEVYRNMSQSAKPDEEDILATKVKSMVGRYLDAKLQKDAGYDFKAYREAKKTPADAAEARRKLAERLFLELRSRRDQAFVEHFTNTFFAVGQYLGDKPAPKMFHRIAKALLTNTDTVKTLTLMALSANAWVPTPKKETAK